MSTHKHTTPWHTMTPAEVKKHLETDTSKGLTAHEALGRAGRHGANTFEEKKKVTLVGRIVAQFKSPLVFILLIAGIATFFLKEFVDMWVIFAALAINVAIGVAQEKRADNAFVRLTASQEKFATVIRDGEKKNIHAEALVPGDIILLATGNRIPADARVVTTQGLMVNESPLTGEWEDVAKQEHILDVHARVPEQTNMLWMGTLVTKGTATAIVTEIGYRTQLGFIAQELDSTKEELIPLQKNIHAIAVSISYIIVAVIVLILIAGLAHGNDLVEMVLLAIAVAVAAMPEGLPAAVTVVLALGMENILKRGGLVRNLLAAETLGNTTVILTDKTGTITKAQMNIADILTERSMYHLYRAGHTPLKDTLGEHDKEDVLSMLLLTSDGYVEGERDALGEWVIHGGPIERAVILAGVESGIHQQDLLAKTPRLDFLPFESKQRFVASLHRHGAEGTDARRVYVAGAPEFLLEKAMYVYSEGKKQKITQVTRGMIAQRQIVESETGMRVVGVGYAELSDLNSFDGKDFLFDDVVFSKFVFSGLVVMHDPVREDVKDSIATAQRAGATVIMITGDNPTTALKIAETVGIVSSDASVLTGIDVDALTDEELGKALATQRVFARILPQQKLRIVRILKSQGEIVAMTGDGINDAPALRNADIGIALGSGTDVAKESSDLILLNNSFSIIVSAIEEGRRIQDNLKKIMVYLLSTSFTELVVIGTSLLIGTPLPILATQVLWINIVQEGFMNFAFAFEPAERGVMERKPNRDIAKQILTSELKKLIGIIAFFNGASLIVLYFVLLYLDTPIDLLRTIMFASLSAGTLVLAFSIKNFYKPLWHINLKNNTYLLGALLLSTTALVLALELPILRNVLHLVELHGKEYLYVCGIAIFNIITIEVAKYVVFKRNK